MAAARPAPSVKGTIREAKFRRDVELTIVSLRILEWEANGLLHVAQGVANYAGGRSATNMQNGCPAGSA